MFRLRVLGGFALDSVFGTVVPSIPKRAEALLAVLAVSGDLGCARERLLALLWPENDEARARHGLRDVLHAIRRTLGPHAVPLGRLLRLDSAIVTSDALTFARAMASGLPADAARAYAGPLLDGFHIDDAAEFERWMDGERTRLAREYGKVLKQLATDAERNGAWDDAVGWWSRAAEHDPLSSHLVLQQVRVLAAIGDRANAIHVAEAHIRRLRDEFELEPDGEILALVERIRRGELPALQGSAPSFTPAVPEPQPEPDAGGRVSRTAVAGIVKPRLHRALWVAGVAALVLGASFGAKRLMRSQPVEAGNPRTSVAILPFRNLNPDSSNAYFAGGLHDELLTQLTKVASLTVVGRTSVSGYLEASKPLRQIGQELRAGSIVEGSVQVVGHRLRVSVQLLDPVTQAELWAESYDRTLDDAFAVQSEITQRIVAAVGARLTSAEAGAIAAAPTRNAQAYAFYLQGLEYYRRPGLLRENFVIAQQLYERALALDSTFAVAHAMVSIVHASMYSLRYDRTPRRLELAQRESELALRLAPDLPQAHVGLGMRYQAGGTYRQALNEFNLGLRGAPNDAEVWNWVGIVQRNLGNWDSAFVAFDHARSLDPRDANLFQTLGDTYHYLRRYREAIEAYRHELAFAPDLVQPRLSLAWSYVLWKGELDTLRAVLRGLPLDGRAGSGGSPFGDQHLFLLLWERRPDSILSLLRAMPSADDAYMAPSTPPAFWIARAQSLRGDSAAARAAFDSALTVLSVDERAHPNDRGLHGMRGVALAALGRREEALREDRWLEHGDDYPGDRYSSGLTDARARILARMGETDAAITLVERLLARPSLFSVQELRLSPDFDPIRSNPRYRTLLSKYDLSGS